MKHSFFQFSEGFTLFNLKINGHLIAFKAEIIQILGNSAPNHTKKGNFWSSNKLHRFFSISISAIVKCKLQFTSSRTLKFQRVTKICENHLNTSQKFDSRWKSPFWKQPVAHEYLRKLLSQCSSQKNYYI